MSTRTRYVHPGREKSAPLRVQRDWPTAKSMKFKSSMDRKGRGYATAKNTLNGPNVNLNGLGTRTPRPQSTSGAKGPTVSMTQKSLAETNAGANHIEVDDQREYELKFVSDNDSMN